MLNIYIARHGEDEDNQKKILNGHRDKKLTAKGIKQAEDLAKKIATTKIEFNHLYSSPLKRCLKTAKIISSKTKGPNPIVIEDLIERNFGTMTGKPLSSIIKLCSPNIIRTKKIDYFLKPDNGETFPQLLKRCKRVISKIKKEHKTGNILLITHGDTGKMLYGAYYNSDWQETLKKFHFDNANLLLLSKNSPANEIFVFK